jgi:tetratricopeptide (TPR) repeat protein
MLLGALSVYHYWVGDHVSAERRARQGYDLSADIRNIECMLLAGSHLGLALFGLGRPQEALDLYERVVAQGRELEALPRFTARCVSMWAGGLRETMSVDEARLRNHEAIELAIRAGFPPPKVEALIDLLFLDLLEGEVGRAERAWPQLQEAAEAMRSWHQWLMIGRLAHARAEIELGRGRLEPAAEEALQSIEHARRVGRRKYEVASRCTLASALLGLGKAQQAVTELRSSVRGAERLQHPPSMWKAWVWLGQALLAIGDERGAESAFQRARQTVEAFAENLSGERRSRFLAARAISDILATAGPPR